MLLVRERELRRRGDGSEYLQLSLGDRTGAVVAVASDARARAASRCAMPARACTSAAATSCTRATARRSRSGGCGRPSRTSTTSTQLLDGPLRPVAGMEAALRDLIEQVRSPHLRALLDRVLGPGRADVGRVPRRAGRQALPPGLPPRAARALAQRRRGGRRDLDDVPGDRPRRRDHRRAAARHRQARRLHERPAGDRHDGPREAARRDLARLLPDPPRDRGHPGLPAPTWRRPCCTSSSATTASSSTARRSCRARARRRSCT